MLSTLPPSMGSQELSLLCPVRALRIYIECSAWYRKSEQLFVSFGNCAKSGPVMKQGISRWLVDAIYYSSILLHGFAVPNRSQSPFLQRHRLFLGMVQRGAHFGNMWGSRLGLAVHICKVLQPGWSCLAGQSLFCLNKLSYGFTWTTLIKPLIHLVYP